MSAAGRGAPGRLVAYLALLARWNRTYNLTAVREPMEMVDRHLLDCLAIVPWLDGVGDLLDVGTGAGLPGLVAAAARPRMRCTLLDSNGKKTRFCIQAAAELGLGNVTVERARLDAYRAPGRFDAVVSRATMGLGELIGPARALLAPAGRVLAMKGAVPDAEIAAARAAGARVRAEPLAVPFLDEPRHLVVADFDAVAAA